MPPPRRLTVARPVPGQQTFFRLANTVLVVAALYWAQVVLVPIALAILLAFALTPPARWLERHGFGRVLSSLVVLAAAFSVLAGLGWVAVEECRNLAADLRKYQDNIVAKVEPVRRLLDEVEKLQNIGGEHPPAAQSGMDPSDVPDRPVPVEIRQRRPALLNQLPTLAVPVGHLLANVLLVAVLTTFLLSQRESFRDRLLALAGRRQLTATTRALEDAGRRVSKYLLLQTGTNATMGCVVALGLTMIGVPYAALWGLLTAGLRFVPYVGIWFSALFPFGLAIAINPGWGSAVLVLVLYGCADVLMTNVVEPLLFGHGTGVSSLALLVAAAFWAFLWGPVGLLLAIPLTVCLVVLGEHVPNLKFLRTLLGDAPEVDPSAKYYHRVLARQYDEAAVLLEEQAAGRPLLDVYDKVMLPTLALAKAERDNGDLSPAEERDFYRVTRDVIDGVLMASRAGSGATDEPTRPDTRVIACATKGDADRLALAMFRDVARQVGVAVEIVPAPRMAAEVQKRCGNGEELVACVATVSPGGLAQAAGVIRQVRGRCPGVRVLVGRWGMTGDTSADERFLTKAGAEKVTWSLRDTLEQIAPAETPDQPSPPEVPAKPGQVTVPT